MFASSGRHRYHHVVLLTVAFTQPLLPQSLRLQPTHGCRLHTRLQWATCITSSSRARAATSAAATRSRRLRFYMCCCCERMTPDEANANFAKRLCLQTEHNTKATLSTLVHLGWQPLGGVHLQSHPRSLSAWLALVSSFVVQQWHWRSGAGLLKKCTSGWWHTS